MSAKTAEIRKILSGGLFGSLHPDTLIAWCLQLCDEVEKGHDNELRMSGWLDALIAERDEVRSDTAMAAADVFSDELDGLSVTEKMDLTTKILERMKQIDAAKAAQGKL